MIGANQAPKVGVTANDSQATPDVSAIKNAVSVGMTKTKNEAWGALL